MRTYLRIINPIIAIAILILCLWAAVCDEGKFEPDAVLKGSIPTYFLAKGLFCSSALFILGRVLLLMITNAEQKKDRDNST